MLPRESICASETRSTILSGFLLTTSSLRVFPLSQLLPCASARMYLQMTARSDGYETNFRIQSPSEHFVDPRDLASSGFSSHQNRLSFRSVLHALRCLSLDESVRISALPLKRPTQGMDEDQLEKTF